MKLPAARASDQIHLGARALAEFSGVVVRLDLELQDPIDIGRDTDAVLIGIRVRGAVDLKGVLLGPGAAYRKTAAVNCPRRSGIRSRDEQSELDKVASIQRKLGDLLGINDGSHRGAGALDQGSLTPYLDNLGQLSDLQDNIDLGVLIHLQRHPRLLKFLEAL